MKATNRWLAWTRIVALSTIEQAPDAKEMLAEYDRRGTRIDELLATVVKVAQQTPFPDELKDWPDQRAAMTAEVGTLKARVAELERRDETCTKLIAIVNHWRMVRAYEGCDSEDDQRLESHTHELIGECPALARDCARDEVPW